MAPLLLSHLVRSLTRQLTQLTRFSLGRSSPTASVYRCLSTLTSFPARALLMPARATSIQAPSPGTSSQNRVSLLGQCQHLACLQPSVGMKTRSALRRRCKDCFFVRRRGHLFVFCKTHPRHKQRQG